MTPQTPTGKAKDASARCIAASAAAPVSLCKVCRSPFKKSAEGHRSPGGLCGSCQRWILVDEDSGCDDSNVDFLAKGLPSHDRHAVQS